VQNADSLSLFDDPDAALQSGSSAKRVAMLRQVTELFLSGADRLNEAQIGLLAISERAQIEPAVTEVLPDRRDQAVVHRVAGNRGAKFSENGFAALLEAAQTDEKLAERKGLRLDLPLDVPRQAHETLKTDFTKLAKPDARRLLRFWQVREVSARSA
jgi:hypothetical protein